MQFSEISEKEFNEYLDHLKMIPFLQTIEFGKLKNVNDIDYYLVGVKNSKNKLCAVASLWYFKNNKIKSLYCSRGPITDYFDEEIMKCFLDGLTELGKRLRVDIIDVEPNYIIRHLDNGFNVAEEKKDLIPVFEKFDYKHRGYFGQIPGFQLRYTVIINLDKTYDELIKGYDSDKKKILSRNEKYFNIKVLESDLSNIDDLIKYRKVLSERKKFHVDEKEYFEKCYSLFNEGYKAKYIRAIADFDIMIKNIKNEIISLDAMIERNVKNVVDIKNQKQSLEQKLKEIEKFKEDNKIKGEYCLGAGIAVYLKNDISYLYEHTEKEINFGVPTIMVDYLLKDGIDNGYKTFDFFGIINPKLKNTMNMGVNSFKTTWGGEIVEYIGVFSRPISRLYSLKKFAKKIYYRLRGRVYEE